MSERLAGKVAIVTGAGRGLGRSVATGFVREGATVVAVARSIAELRQLEGSLSAEAGTLQFVAGDVSDDQFVMRLVRQTLASHDRIDILVNNAAILEPRLFLDMSLADFDRTIAVNLRAPVVLTHAVLPSMVALGRGSIINVGSGASTRGFELETHYCAAKYGLEGFSESLAMELRPHNIAVNRLTPGFLIKPTSVTLEAAARAPADLQAAWQDPMPMIDAFTWLALQDGAGVSGYLFDAFELAEAVRSNGWTTPIEPISLGQRSVTRVG